MNNLILLTSAQYPGHNDEATNMYSLIKSLRLQNFKVFGIFFENTNVNVDPDNIGDVIRFDCYTFEKKIKNMISSYQNILKIKLKTDPSIILCKNYKSPIFCSLLYPNVKIIYLITDFPMLSKREFIENDNVHISVNDDETKAINSSDLLITNDKISLKLLSKIYIKYIKKIYPYPLNILVNDLKLSRRSHKKIYDFVVITSVINKNDIFLTDVLQNPKLFRYNKIIIGNDNNKFKDIPNSVLFESLSHKEIMQYINKSKILPLPFFDNVNPLIYEAIRRNCILLITNDLNYSNKFPDFLICDSYDVNEWVDKSLYIIENYNELVETYGVGSNINGDIVTFINKFI